MLARTAVAALALIAGCAAAAADPAVKEPEGYRLSDYRSPVPDTLQGARVVDVDEASELRKRPDVLFIDVYPRPPKPDNLPPGTLWRQPAHQTIAGAVWLPNVGYGVLYPAVEDYFRTRLERLTGGNTGSPLVIFCQRDCWMSWNAAKRALGYGYGNVVWFPEGTDGWDEAGLPLAAAEPLP